MLHVDVISLFPEMFAPVIGLSIVGRAIERGLIGVTVHDLLDRHPLRAADSLQLAAALFLASRIGTVEFVVYDERLAAAARAERLVVRP